MWRPEAKLIFGYLITAIFQVFWHWFLSTDNELARSLLRFYLSYDPKIGKGVAGWFDLILPCVLLGVLTGLVGWKWPVRKLAGFVVLIGIGLVVLLLAYPYLLDQGDVWWWPKQNPDFVIIWVQKIVQAVLMVGVFAYGGRCLGAYFNREIQ